MSQQTEIDNDNNTRKEVDQIKALDLFSFTHEVFPLPVGPRIAFTPGPKIPLK